MGSFKYLLGTSLCARHQSARTHLCRQCAAVSIHLSLMREPPQTWDSPKCRLTCQGQSSPPTTWLEYTGRPHTRERGKREAWESGCAVLLIPILSSPNSHPFLGPESSRASILHPIPVPSPAVLGPRGDHSPDCRGFLWKEKDRQDAKTNTPYH